VARQVELRPITDSEGNRLLGIVGHSSGSVVTWRRAQMVLLAAQAMPVGQIAKVTFTSEDRVRDGSTTSTPTGSTRSPHALGPAGHVHAPATPADQEDRPVTPTGS
jgi:hypothetical protein